MEFFDEPGPLEGIRVVTLAPNVPGPVAAARLRDLGAHVTKVEAPEGDPLEAIAPRWYEALHRNCVVERLDLKTPAGREQLDVRLRDADVLLTSSRPSALARLGLAWEDVHERHPDLVLVAIVGELPPDEERPGHDLTYLATLGLLDPPGMPRTLLADLAGAERAAGVAAALLLRRARGLGASRAYVSLREAARPFGAPFEHGLTVPGGRLAGGFGPYRIYRSRDGWLALAALEPHFVRRLCEALRVADYDAGTLAAIFAERDGREWEAFAREHDLPLELIP